MTVPHKVIRPKSIGVSSLRTGPFYTVASVELGNTTVKCIITSTNLKTAEIFEVGKEVRFTRDVRSPQSGEDVFGTTLMGVELTRESVAELVKSILLSTISRARLSIERDLHFVVRSTGVTASFATPDEVGAMVKALAEGCLQAGIPPKKMMASLDIENLPPGIRQFSWLKKVYFDGAVASSLPPANTEIVANEMEGELVTAGIKGAVKGREIDFRSPVITLDFGTTLAGRISDANYPYSNTIGSFAGLAGAIPDAIARGAEDVDSRTGCAQDLTIARSGNVDVDPTWVHRIHDLIKVEKLLHNTQRFGTVPVDVRAADEAGVTIIGVDVGDNGSHLDDLTQIGSEIIDLEGLPILVGVIDRVQTFLVQRIVQVATKEGLVLPETSLGLTGRSITTGMKPRLISDTLRTESGTLWIEDHPLIFVEDGLAMGAAVAARCMNSLGTPKHPMGGRRGDRCIMTAREKLQSGGSSKKPP